MNTERRSAKWIQALVRERTASVVAKHPDGNYTNIGMSMAAKMDGQSYLVTETKWEVIVAMDSARKEAAEIQDS